MPNTYRVRYKHVDTPDGDGFYKTVTASTPEEAVSKVLVDPDITCPCCDPIRIESVYQCAYGREKEVPEPATGWELQQL